MMSARKLAEYIINEADLRHLDAQGGAWYALELVEILTSAEENGWRIVAPEDHTDSSGASQQALGLAPGSRPPGPAPAEKPREALPPVATHPPCAATDPGLSNWLGADPRAEGESDA